MPFEKGKSGNPSGRPKETTMTNKEMKALFKQLLQQNTEYLLDNLSDLTIRDRINLQRTLSAHVMPKLSSVQLHDDNFNPISPIEITIKNENPNH